jgi:tRNA threonylcarbamoyladenosine biosynthesis protein TsaB
MPQSLDPRILAFDTSSTRESVALLEGQDLAAELKLNSLQTHSASLLRSIEFLLGRVGWSLETLNLVAVGIGPGSFTGIRIGVATALGIAQSLSIPFTGISGLDALAYKASHLNGHIGVMLDARRSQAFYAEYISKSGKIRPVRNPELLHLSALECRLKGRHLYIVGDAHARYGMRPTSLVQEWPSYVAVDLFLAESIGRLACSRKRTWRSGNYLLSEPLYIRPPDAIQNRRWKR